MLKIAQEAACLTAGSCVARDGAKLVLSQPAAQRKENLTLRAEISTTKSVFFLDL